MNNSTPPAPQPGGATPACGAAQSANAAIYTNCGVPLQVGAPDSLLQTGKIIASVALPLGADFWRAGRLLCLNGPHRER